MSLNRTVQIMLQIQCRCHGGTISLLASSINWQSTLWQHNNSCQMGLSQKESTKNEFHRNPVSDNIKIDFSLFAQTNKCCYVSLAVCLSVEQMRICVTDHRCRWWLMADGAFSAAPGELTGFGGFPFWTFGTYWRAFGNYESVKGFSRRFFRKTKQFFSVSTKNLLLFTPFDPLNGATTLSRISIHNCFN